MTGKTPSIRRNACTWCSLLIYPLYLFMAGRMENERRTSKRKGERFSNMPARKIAIFGAGSSRFLLLFLCCRLEIDLRDMHVLVIITKPLVPAAHHAAKTPELPALGKEELFGRSLREEFLTLHFRFSFSGVATPQDTVHLHTAMFLSFLVCLYSSGIREKSIQQKKRDGNMAEWLGKS